MPLSDAKEQHLALDVCVVCRLWCGRHVQLQIPVEFLMRFLYVRDFDTGDRAKINFAGGELQGVIR